MGININKSKWGAFFLLYIFLSLEKFTVCSTNVPASSSSSDFPAVLSYISNVAHMSPEMLSMVAISHASTTLGFFGKFHYFFSLGYGFAVSSVAVTGSVLLREKLNRLSLLHSLGVFLYGVRLSAFLLWREKKSAAFQQHQLEYYAKMGGPKQPPLIAKLTTWPMVSILYVLLYLPCYTVIQKGLQPNIFGVVMLFLGLVVESIADYQKSAMKGTNPGAFVSSGLYKYSRHANYFGEILMWVGVWIGGIPSYSTAQEWVRNSLAPVFMVYLMVTVTKSLDERQTKKYGSYDGFAEYVKRTPVLFPFIPLYDLGRKKKEI